MKDLKQYTTIMRVMAALLLFILFFGGHFTFIINVYIFIFLLMVIRTLMVPAERKIRFYLIVVYIAVMTIQILFLSLVVFQKNQTLFQSILSRLFGAIIVLFPFIVERFVTINKYASFYLPSAHEISSISFAQIKHGTHKVIDAVETVKKAGKAFSPENLETITRDLYRHNSFKYISKEVLTKEYFNHAASYLQDPHIYIIISNTGSPASEIISTFTQKQYNHASLSFDYDLETIISYNGGERVYPPGLNHEMVEYFNQKEDASIIVYQLDCTLEQKKSILDKIKEINEEGSAYNMMGLVLKFSHKPNIMFCSQFVYKMLKLVGLAYFEQKDGYVKPTDLVELDYYRKLHFAYELKLNNHH